ncbi:MAG: hypothetical protein WDN04_26590 [Rhodospirillales bacterium]
MQLCLPPPSCSRPAPRPPRDPEAEASAIRSVLIAQAAAWNRGDIDAFMQGYRKSDELRFASGDTVTYGWQQTRDRYLQRYPDRAAMGTLIFFRPQGRSIHAGRRRGVRPLFAGARKRPPARHFHADGAQVCRRLAGGERPYFGRAMTSDA